MGSLLDDFFEASYDAWDIMPPVPDMTRDERDEFAKTGKYIMEEKQCVVLIKDELGKITAFGPFEDTNESFKWMLENELLTTDFISLFLHDGS